MTEYLIAKWLHILFSTLLFGTGIGTAFYLFFVSHTRNVAAIAVVSRFVVIADWWFTATTIVLQPLTGIWLARIIGYPMDRGWLLWSSVMLGLATACWLPVLWLQVRMRDLAVEAAANGTDLPPRYWRYLHIWTALGVPALLLFLAIFWLMVARPPVIWLFG